MGHRAPSSAFSTHSSQLASPAGQPRRVLVDWDYGAHGLWLLLTPQEQKRQEPLPNLPSWSQLLPAELLDALTEWNEDRCEADHRRRDRQRNAEDHLLDQRALSLGEQVQAQLGPEWEVLYAAHGAWHWVRSPQNWM